MQHAAASDARAQRTVPEPPSPAINPKGAQTCEQKGIFPWGGLVGVVPRAYFLLLSRLSAFGVAGWKDGGSGTRAARAFENYMLHVVPDPSWSHVLMQFRYAIRWIMKSATPLLGGRAELRHARGPTAKCIVHSAAKCIVHST